MRCMLCGSEKLELISDKLRRGEGKVWHCESCDLGILETAERDQEAYYREEYRKKFGPALDRRTDFAEMFEMQKLSQQAKAERLAEHLPENARLLEVGCSAGQFLYHIKDHVAEAVGVDLDSEAVRYAAEKTGCTTHDCLLEETGLAKESFDVVCAVQVVEHVEDPVAFVRMLGEYLKPGGLIYIEVPNLYDPLLSVVPAPAYQTFYYHEAHLYYFSERSLTDVMQRAGFSGSCEFVQDYNLMNHLHWAFKDAPQNTCAEGLSTDRFPAAPDCPPELARQLDKLMERVGTEYKAILAEHGMTDNLLFIGKKAE